MDDETQLWSRPDGGRHEIDQIDRIDEDAQATPIFAALVRGGWRQRQAAEAERFRRDPLTAPFPTVIPLPVVPLPVVPLPVVPLPVVPLTVVPLTVPAPAPSPARGGRHHLRPRPVPHYA